MAATGVGTRGTQAAPRGRANAQPPRMAPLNRMMLRIVLVVLLASLFLYVNRMATIAGGAKTINRLHTLIAAEEGRRQQLEIQLAERQNLEMIGNEAVSRLGMVRPGSWSVRVVTLPGETVSGEGQTAYDAAGESATP